MKLVHVGSTWNDSMGETYYHGYVWNFNTMKPEQVSLPHGSFKVEKNSLDFDCYKIFIHNEKHLQALRAGLENTDCPGRCGYGDVVKVVRGRLVPIGTIAAIVKTWETHYGKKCIIRDNKNEYKTYIKNLEVLSVSLTVKPEGFSKLLPYPAITKFQLAMLEETK